MTIPHFSDQQNLVFVPALLALLVAAVLICVPVVLAPTLRRGRAGGRVLTVAAGVLAASALVVAGWQAGVGFRTLQDERLAVAAQLQSRYGIDLPAGDVNELLNGGKPRVALPQLASTLGLKATTSGKHDLHLLPEQEGADVYRLVYGGQTVPSA